MQTKMKAIFQYSFLVMYAVAQVIWENFITYLPAFTAFDASYSEETAADALKAIETARLLPDASTRRAVSKKLRKGLRLTGKKCCNNFKVLLAYIEKSFTPADVAAMKQAAGSESYLKASSGNLLQIEALNTAAATFIKSNSDALTAGGMPATFITTFMAAKAEFDKLNASYVTAKQSERKETNAKIVANNAVYTTLAKAMKDAKIIFMNDAVTRAYFTYEAIAVRFKKEGKTGYRFVIEENTSEAPLLGAVVTLQPGNIIVKSDKKGAALAELQKNIKYTYTIVLPGYIPITGSNLVTVPGVIKRIKIALTPVAAATAQ